MSGVSVAGLPTLQRSQEGPNKASFVRRIDERGLRGIIGRVRPDSLEEGDIKALESTGLQ